MSVHHFTKRKILYIDSQQQLTSTNNIFSVSIDAELDEDYDMCSLISAQIPVSFYIIQTGSNTMTLLEGNQSISITIPEGNYSVYSFQSTVGPLLSAASLNGYTYTLLFNNVFTQVDTGKFTFQCSSTAKVVGFQFPPNNAVSEPFGFFPGTTNYFSNAGSVQTLSSKNVISFIPESSIFIHANFCQGSSQSGYTDVLSCIFSSNSAPYSTINYVNPQIYETAKKTCNLSRVMIFSITDEYGNAIYCNGGNVLLQILLFKSPEQPSESKINKIIENYIEMKTNIAENDEIRRQSERDELISILRRIEEKLTNKISYPESDHTPINNLNLNQDKDVKEITSNEEPKTYFAGKEAESSNPPQQTG